jgi:DNA repair protein RecN (Recombination protein N)
MDQQKLSKILLGAQQNLMSSQPITERLNSAAHHLENGQKMGTAKLDTVLSAIQRASIEATEAEAALEDAIQELDLESETLESLEERLFTLKALARKHNTDIESLGSLLTDFQSRLDLIDKNDEYIEDLSEKCKMTRKIYEEHSQALSLCRNKAAKALDKAIFSELKPLKLGNARFKTYIEEVSEEAQNKFGINRVRFQITTTPGTELGPIEKVASGGERARLLLALKVCLSHSADIST